MEYCCICLGDIQSPVILNSGISLCGQCVHKLHRCPSNYIEITSKFPNKFIAEFFRYPPLPPIFSMKKLLKSPDKIAYMNQFDKIELYDPEDLFDYNYDKFLLNIDEFKVFASKCINLNYEEMIHYACIGCDLDIVKYLVEEHSVDINCTKDGWYPIHVAFNSLDIVKYLVEKGADINCRGRNGKRLIHIACDNDRSIELIKWLITRGVIVNCTNNDNLNPIHYACKYGNNMLEVVKLLVDCGVDVNCADIWGGQPIHYACESGNGSWSFELIKYLISCGANVNSFTKNGTHPLHIAYRKRRSSKIIQLLEKNGANLKYADDTA